MEWTSNVAAGEWIRERLDPEGLTFRSFVPRGFPAYARVFHPAHRERPVGLAWPAVDDRDGWDCFLAERPEVDTERVTWRQVADAFGTTMHELAQWHRLVHRSGPETGEPRDADGWRYAEPDEGRLEPEALAAVARHLAAHTATPGDGFAALWEGWGGVVGGMSSGAPSTSLLAREAGDPHHQAMLGASMRDAFNNVLRRPKWRSGVLSDEISRGPRLELPQRGHVLFQAAPREWTDPSWPERVPWSDGEWTQSPSLIWPEGREWVLVSEIDFDSTIVCGSAELIRAICTDPEIEAHAIRADADLTWDADDLNRPTGA